MRPNHDGKSGPVNFKREMARRARIERAEANPDRQLAKALIGLAPEERAQALTNLTPAGRARILAGLLQLKRGRPKKIGIRWGVDRAKRGSLVKERTCSGCGKSFKPQRSDAKCCSARCRKRVSRRSAQSQAGNGSSVTLS
jgi:hypothetical protein